MLKRTTLIERLQKLPDVFDLKLFCLNTGIEHNSAKVMMSRWAKRGYIKLAGPKAGIYFKCAGASMDPSEQTLAAVLHLYPSATLCGASVLHRNGWTTQIPRSIQVAIEDRPSLVLLHGVDLFPRSTQWFTTISQNRAFEPNPRVSLETPSSRIRVMRPAWALADLRSFKDGWIPDEDDLDLPDDQLTSGDLNHAQTILNALNLTEPMDDDECASIPCA